jgi:N-acetyl-beta-hexosaminidase
MKEIFLRTDDDYFMIEVIDYPQVGWMIMHDECRYHINSIEIYSGYYSSIIYNVCLLL